MSNDQFLSPSETVAALRELVADPDIPREVKRQLVLQERQMWANTGWLARMRWRMQKSLEKLGGNPDAIASLEKEVTLAQAAIDVLDDLLKLIDQDQANGINEVHEPQALEWEAVHDRA